MPRPKLILASLCLAAAAGLGAGCGGDEDPEPSIPLDSATTLVSTLQEIQDNVDAGSCERATAEVQEFEAELDALPSGVDGDVVEALQRGAQNLLGLIEEDCDQPEEETTTEDTESTPTETQETETDTQPTETEETTTTETMPTEPPPDTGGGGIGPPGGGDGL